MSAQPTVTDLFRPVSELRAALGWTAAGVASSFLSLFSGVYVHLFWWVPCIAFSVLWMRRAVLLIAFRVQLHASRLALIPVETLRQYCKWGQNPAQAPFEYTRGQYTTPVWWLGKGFEWQPTHATLAMDMQTRDRDTSYLLGGASQKLLWRAKAAYEREVQKNSILARVAKPWVDRLQRTVYGQTISDRTPIGESWIHALGTDKIDVLYRESAMQGHTFVVGSPGSGKTRLYEALVTQAIHGDNVVIVVDPKFDDDWERRCRTEAQKTGRKYVYFNLAKLSDSARIDTIKNWNDPSEIASRITGLLQGANGDPFIKFAHLSIDRAVKGLLFCQVRPSLRKIKDIVERGVGPLLIQCLQVVFEKAIGPDWLATLETAIRAASEQKDGSKRSSSSGGDSVLNAMVALFMSDPRFAQFRSQTEISGLLASAAAYDTYSGEETLFDRRELLQISEAVGGLITTFEHNKEHYGKMILTLLPLLNNLCSGEVGEVLSPDPLADDPREIWDIRRAVEEKAVVYIGLNTLANREVGQAIGSMLLADAAAVVGYMYNSGFKRNVCLFVDEAAEVVNPQFVQILNKGRGAGWRVFFATQTIPDLEVKLGSKAAATQVLGNANNFICGRVQDMSTREYMSQLFGETRVFEQTISSSQGTESDATALEFRGSVSYSNKKTKGMLVHPDLLGRLANMHYFAMIEGGHVYKTQIPILQD